MTVLEFPAPSSCGICLVVTNLSLKPEQLLEVFILIEKSWRACVFLKKGVRIKLTDVDEVNIWKK